MPMEALVNCRQLPVNFGVQCTFSPITGDLWHNTHTSNYGNFQFQKWQDLQDGTDSEIEQSDGWLQNDCTKLYVQLVAKIQYERIRGQCHSEKKTKDRNLCSDGSKQKLLLFILSSFCFVFVSQTQKACPTPARWKLCERKCMRL